MHCLLTYKSMIKSADAINLLDSFNGLEILLLCEFRTIS